VRIGHHAGRAPGHDGPGELRRGHHAALDVHVAINEARADVHSLEVNSLPGLVIAQPHDTVAGDSDVGLDDLMGEDIHHSGVPEQQIGFLLPSCKLDYLR